MDDEEYYTLVGMRSNPLTPEGESDFSLEIIGTFTDYEKAVMARDVYHDLDTTINFLSIIPTVVRDDVPDVNVMLHVVAHEDHGIFIESRCSFYEDEPWLKADGQSFESLAWPEDEESVVSVASDWYRNNFGAEPKIERIISDSLDEYT